MKTFLALVLLLGTLDAFAWGSSSRSSSSRSSSRSSFSSRTSSSSFSSRPSSYSRTSSSSSFSRPSAPVTKTVSTPTVFKPVGQKYPMAPRNYAAPKSIPLTTTKTITVPASRPSASVTPRLSGNRTVTTAPTTRTVVRRTVVRTEPRYIHNNVYYSYPSVSLSSMMLTAALLSAARQDWTYTAIHIENNTPSRVCKCDSLGRLYSCGLWRDEDDYVCKQFRILPDEQVEWR